MNRIRASEVQRGIWFSERAGRAGTAYHMGIVLELTGELDPAALRAAVAAVVARHPVLSCRLSDEDGVLWLVPASVAPSLTTVGDPPSGPLVELSRPFDLDHGPLLRFVLSSPAPEHHVLLIAAHHLVFDGVSKEILVRELARAYNRARDGGPDPGWAAVPEAIAAPADRSAAELDAARRHWAEHWREATTPVLPGLTRVPTQAEPGQAHEVGLDPALAAGLRSAAAATGVTTFEFLLAALLALLGRYGDPAPTVAVDVSTRDPGDAATVGPYVNELPVSVAAPGLRTFREFARSVRAEFRRLNPIRTVPVASAVTGLRPRGSLAPVSLSYRRPHGEEPKFTGLDVAVDWLVFPGMARNALHLQVLDGPGGLAVSLRYSPTALDPGAAGRIATHLGTLLTGAAADPDAPVARLPLLGPAERDQVRREWCGTGGTDTGATTLTHLFQARVRAAPDAVAIIHNGQTWRYRELAARVDGLAGRLRAAGVGPGDLVGVCLDRSVDLVAALLAVGRAGAAYVPVDPAYPAARRQLILADAAPRVLIAEPALAAGVDATVLTVDGDADADADADRPAGGPADDHAGDPVARPADLAYVMYTSGSTGSPKGVAVPHRALVSLLAALRDRLASGERDVWLAHTSISFDISGLELFLPLTTGAALVLASTTQARSGTGLLGLVRAHGVSHLQATPAGWRLLLDAGFGLSTVERKRVVALVGGEALPLGLATELRGRVRRLDNVYGPTETTIWSTVDGLPDPVTEVTIGRPLANTRAYVYDEHLEPVPVGVPGELYLGGAGLADGYRRRPELTAERFIADPLEPGGRLYRTGDRVSWRPDGRLAFHGRLDSQVKVLGHRIELGEVEARLAEHPGVRQAAAALRPDGPDGARLVGYLVPEDGGTAPEPAALRDRLRRTLPDAAVPVAWVVLDRLPLTPNGKLDRAALPDPVRPAVNPAGTPIGTPADGGSLLAAVRRIWCDALRVPRLDDDEDLFDAGGNSLTVIQIMNQMSERLGVDVPLDAFYDTPTVAEIVALAAQLGGGGPA